MVTISEAATQLRVSIDTIRRWEKKGLIKAHRDSRNYKFFSIEELKRAYAKYISGDKIDRYRVLKAPEASPYTCIELFAGAGGLALGLENAGLKSKLLVEIDKYSCATLKKNRPEWNVICADAKNVSYRGISADIVTGGFPCQAFSYSGQKLGFQDTRGTLFFELARCVDEVKPKLVLGENVRGLLMHDNGRTLDTMLTVLDELGYRVAYRVVRAQYLDVPQKRERLIIIGIRQDLKCHHLFPKERDYTISLREALKDVPPSLGQKYPERKRQILELVPPGGYWKDLPEHLQREYLKGSFHLSGGKTGMARRLAWDEPSLTLTCAPAQKQTERCHPSETRPLTVREYARIQTFPDSWEFEGSMSEQYKQIGNAVPVNLGYHLGRCLIHMLSDRSDDEEFEHPVVQELQLSLF